MKKQFLTFLLSAIFASAAVSQSLPDVVIETLPQTIDEFTNLRDQMAATPEGGAAMFILALKIYIADATLGQQCLIVSTDKGSLVESTAGYKGYSLLKHDMDLINRQLDNNPSIPDSYIKGSSPDNNYKTELPYTMQFSYNSYCGDPQTGVFKVFVACSGADSPRPIHIRRNDKGIWKASNWSSVLVNIKKAAASTTDDL